MLSAGVYQELVWNRNIVKTNFKFRQINSILISDTLYYAIKNKTYNKYKTS
jgi:hypothetical protein